MKALFFIIFSLVTAVSFADSPLTSTSFSAAYKSDEAIKHVKEKGLDEMTLKYLGGKKTDPVIKIAIINELSWGKEEYLKAFESYLLANRKGLKSSVFEELRATTEAIPTETSQTKRLTADDLMCWAYLQALGNYFNPSLARAAAKLATEREKGSMAHATVDALIRSQIAFDESWCKVYQIGNLAFEETRYTRNQLSKEAVAIIMEYLVLYKGDC